MMIGQDDSNTPNNHNACICCRSINPQHLFHINPSSFLHLYIPHAEVVTCFCSLRSVRISFCTIPWSDGEVVAVAAAHRETDIARETDF